MADPNSYRVTVTDIDIPFGRLVAFFVKVALAAIPAMLIVGLFVRLLVALIATVFVGLGHTGF